MKSCVVKCFFSSLSHRQAARCSDVSTLKLEQNPRATANVFQQSSAALRLTEGLSEYYHSQRGGWNWYISITPCFYRTICSVVVANMSDNMHTVTDLQGCSTDSSDPSLFLRFFSCFCFQTVAFRKAFRGVYTGDLLPLIRHVSGWIQWLLEVEVGGMTARLLIQQFPCIPACSAHSSPSPPTPSLLYFWKHLILVSQALHARRALFPAHLPPRQGEKDGGWVLFTFKVFSPDSLFQVQTSPPSRSICGAKCSIWSLHSPDIHLNLKRGSVGAADWWSLGGLICMSAPLFLIYPSF